MDLLQTLMPFVTNGGIPVILFIIWYFTFTRSNTQFDNAVKYSDQRFADASKESKELFALALEETRAKSAESIKHANELFRESSNRSERIMAEANTRHEKLLLEMVQIQKEEAKAKELLVGILSSMKTTLEAK